MDTHCSDEIETLDGLAEVLVGDWDLLLLGALRSISNQVGKSVSILDGRWHLDGASHIVVCIAELVGQLLDLGGIPTC